MALGSSAPEILLSVIETISGFGNCPGELGASTIVGSAAFNLLVICGVSIYAVSEENDTDEGRDTSTPDGVKKINDMRVYAITCSFSLFAYIWLFICVRDNGVAVYEAILTFVFFWTLIIFAYLADTSCQFGGKVDEEEEQALNDHVYVEFSTVEIYRTLIEEKKNPNQNQSEEHKKKIEKMKKFLKETMHTDEIDRIDLKELKEAVEGKSMLTRVQYRKQVGLGGKKMEVAKHAVFKNELRSASHAENPHPQFGFTCLHYSVSEASGSIRINVKNKTGKPGSVRVCTIDQEAKDGDDYEKVDEVLTFTGKETDGLLFITVKINDDDNWEPDEDFWVQLYEPSNPDQVPIEQAVEL